MPASLPVGSSMTPGAISLTPTTVRALPFAAMDGPGTRCFPTHRRPLPSSAAPRCLFSHRRRDRIRQNVRPSSERASHDARQTSARPAHRSLSADSAIPMALTFQTQLDSTPRWSGFLPRHSQECTKKARPFPSRDLDGNSVVPEGQRAAFLPCQGRQGFPRRRTLLRRTRASADPSACGSAPAQAGTEIVNKRHFRTDTRKSHALRPAFRSGPTILISMSSFVSAPQTKLLEDHAGTIASIDHDL